MCKKHIITCTTVYECVLGVTLGHWLANAPRRNDSSKDELRCSSCVFPRRSPGRCMAISAHRHHHFHFFPIIFCSFAYPPSCGAGTHCSPGRSVSNLQCGISESALLQCMPHSSSKTHNSVPASPSSQFLKTFPELEPNSYWSILTVNEPIVSIFH